MTPFPLPSGWAEIKALPKSLAESLVRTLSCCSWVDFIEGISSLGLWSRHRRLQRAALDPSHRDKGAFSLFSVLWNAHGALCCRTSLETAFREALLTGQVNYHSHNNILLVKQREQQAWIQSLSLALKRCDAALLTFPSPIPRQDYVAATQLICPALNIGHITEYLG